MIVLFVIIIIVIVVRQGRLQKAQRHFLYLHLEMLSGFLKIAICFPLQDDFEYNLLTKNSIVLALPNTILLT